LVIICANFYLAHIINYQTGLTVAAKGKNQAKKEIRDEERAKIWAKMQIL
jgi:hypothetical protein